MNFLIAGETLIDLISQDFADQLPDAQAFIPLPGGSAANLSVNLSRLGNKAGIATCLGADGWGQHMRLNLENEGVNIQFVQHHATEPTTVVLVTRSRHTPDFLVYRGADAALWDTGLPDFPTGLKVFHTTCFALSKAPAQQRIMEAAALLAERGCQLSIDTNYAAKVWPDRNQAHEILRQWCRWGAIIKCSEDDWARIMDTPDPDPMEAADFFLNHGAKQVCITLGAKGCLSATQTDRQVFSALPLDAVADATGAGDAFWAGYLTAFGEGHSAHACAQAGLRSARAKLSVIGPIPKDLSRTDLLSNFFA